MIMVNNIAYYPRKFYDCTGYGDEKVAKYFGIDRTLSKGKVVELLVSTSFGANSILYAVWLGYLMGMWAMLIHFAWCMSFCLLSYFSKYVYKYTSIQDFISCHFGTATKKISAICSIVGLLYFTGWEIAMAKSGLESFTANLGFGKSWVWSLLLISTICVALIYSVIGGQRVNGYVNLIMNRIKVILLVAIVIGVLIALNNSHISTNTLMPSFSSAVKSLGFTGLITNILINLSWQFVDNSSWQIISFGKTTETDNTKSSLIKSGTRIFLIYAAETFLGASLRGISGLESDNVMSGILNILGSNGNLFFIMCIIILLIFSMMSLIDGMSLSVAQTVMVDLNFGKSIKKLNQKFNLQTSRIVTLFLGILAAWGIQFILTGVGKSVFDFVYVFTVVQLSLIGPVLIGLVFRPQNISKMWISVVLSVVIGFLLNILGSVYNIAWISDVAGTITVTTSTTISLLLYWHWKKKNSSANLLLQN